MNDFDAIRVNKQQTSLTFFRSNKRKTENYDPLGREKKIRRIENRERRRYRSERDPAFRSCRWIERPKVAYY